MASHARSGQFLEYKRKYENNKSAIHNLARTQLSYFIAPSLETVSLSDLYHVSAVLDNTGQPVRIHHAMEKLCPRPLLLPTLAIQLDVKPETSEKLERCVQALRGELPNHVATPQLADHRFGIEFFHGDWSQWFPPKYVELTGGDEKVYRCFPGAHSILDAWARSFETEASSKSNIVSDLGSGSIQW
jgi:hypothetical protein